MRAVDASGERQGFAALAAAIIRDSRLSQTDVSVFSCIPSQVFEVKHDDLAFI